MDLFSNIALGLHIALSFEALLFCLVGVSIGMLVGVLPGIGPLTAISLALPMTYHLEPTLALIMLAGIFYGTQYGGSTAAILLNLPGSVTSAVACLDGYPMAQKGRAGVALFITTIASFVGGTFAIVLVMAFAPLIAEWALSFSSFEYFSVMLLGLIAASTLSVGSPMKGLAMVIFGLALGMVGMDVNSGQFRFTFGLIQLNDGISLVAVAMGLFGVAEILSNVGRKGGCVTREKISMRSMLPNGREWREMRMPMLRGSVTGSLVGALPGTGATIASFMSYAIEKRVSRDKSQFGQGSVAGLTAPESANNAAVQAAFIPTLSLGIPGDAVMAVMLGAMMIHGIVPGPMFLTEQPAMFWGLVMSFWIGNLLLLILNIPLIGMWVKMLSIPYHILYPSILVFICIGVFSVRNNMFDIYVVMGFGVIGYLMMKYRYPAAPLLLGFILGPLLEEHFRRSMLLARGNFQVFLERPVSATFIVLSVLLLLISLRPLVRPLLRPGLHYWRRLRGHAA